MKRFLPAILTLLLAVSLVLLYQSRQTITELETELAAAKVAQKNPAARSPGTATPNANKTTASASARTDTNPAERPETEKETEKAKGKPKNEKSEAAMDLLMGAGAKDIAARSQSRINLLRDRLKLRPDQLGTLEKEAARRNGEIFASFERLRQNKATPPDFGIMMDWMLGNHDLPVRPILDADQSQTYDAMATTERTGRVENAVNLELLELQGQGGLHLTAEQKDQVFNALSGIIADEDALGSAYYADDGKFMTRIDDSLARRRAAMAAVLDETMMQSYDGMLADDRKQVISLFGSEHE